MAVAASFNLEQNEFFPLAGRAKVLGLGACHTPWAPNYAFFPPGDPSSTVYFYFHSVALCAVDAVLL